MIIHGTIEKKRISSQRLEENIQEAIKNGNLNLEIKAQGQHGIGGRIWPHENKVTLKVSGPVGQRLGAMGMPGTEIIVNKSVSDDVGWLNCGAKITVLGDATNGAHNAGAQGILYVQGSGGARCDTMTKQNPRFAPLQSWYFRDVGDSFAEFKAGGIAVVCGVNPRNPENVLGYRPCVGMVGGTIYVRGPIQEFTANTVHIVPLEDSDWQWLTDNMKPFLQAIKRTKYLESITSNKNEWQKIIALSPSEKSKSRKTSHTVRDFRRHVWEKEVGKDGIFGDMLPNPPFKTLPYIGTGNNRLLAPTWQNKTTMPPCAGACPADIPSAQRFALLHVGKFKEAADLVFEYSPFPASVCGAVCPNMCMKACTRKYHDVPLDIKTLGRTEENSAAPEINPSTGHKIAIIGAGPAGLTAAWILAIRGHSIDLYEAENRLGGKLWDAVDKGKLNQKTLENEVNRIKSTGINIIPENLVAPRQFEKICQDYDGVIITCGVQKKHGLGLRFLSTDIECIDGKVKNTHSGQTSNPKIFVAGDVISRGLPPHAIGQARKSALALTAFLQKEEYSYTTLPTILPKAMKSDYFEVDPQQIKPLEKFFPQEEAQRCFSCGLCRDCRICELSCHSKAISRESQADGSFKYVVDESRCIGCGFCAGLCPCGIWVMHENRQDLE